MNFETADEIRKQAIETKFLSWTEAVFAACKPRNNYDGSIDVSVTLGEKKKRRVTIKYDEAYAKNYDIICDPDDFEDVAKAIDDTYVTAMANPKSIPMPEGFLPADVLANLRKLKAPSTVPPAAPNGRPSMRRGNNKPVAAPTIITAAELHRREFEPLKWVVPGYVPEGFTLLSGRPKIGKSWLNLDIALGVARGSTCLGGIQCEKGEVLYLALEDNQRRLKSRIDKLTEVTMDATFVREPWPPNLHLATQWPRADEGGLELIEKWIDAHPGARLVIVDVMAMFRAAANRSSAYEQDYLAIKGLHDIGSRRRLGIIGTHHNRKSASESGDPFDLVSGTLGLTGGADAGLILDRNSQGTTLYVRGRDIDEKESAVTFDKLTCRWRVLGEASEVRRSDERKKILDFLKGASEPLGPRQIAAGIEMPVKNVDRLLSKLVTAGEVEKAGRGWYIHASRTDLRRPDADANVVFLHPQEAPDGTEDDNT